MLKDELLCDSVLFLSLCVWNDVLRSGVIDVFRSDVIDLVRCGVLQVLVCSAGVRKCCSCGCAVSNTVHFRVLFNGGSWAGVIMVGESNTRINGSNTMFL